MKLWRSSWVCSVVTAAHSNNLLEGKWWGNLTQRPEPTISMRCCVINLGHVFEPWTITQGATCASWMVCLSRFKPRTEWCTKGLFLPLLLAVLERQNTRHQPWEYPPLCRPLQLLFLCVGGEWWLVRNPTTLTVDSSGRSLIGWTTTTMSPIWQSRWHDWIYIEIWLRQWALSARCHFV